MNQRTGKNSVLPSLVSIRRTVYRHSATDLPSCGKRSRSSTTPSTSKRLGVYTAINGQRSLFACSSSCSRFNQRRKFLSSICLWKSSSAYPVCEVSSNSSDTPSFRRSSSLCSALKFHRYLRALAAIYIRMTFRAVEVYELLEPLLKDYRKLRLLSMCEF